MKRKAAILLMAGVLALQTPLAAVAETTVSDNSVETQEATAETVTAETVTDTEEEGADDGEAEATSEETDYTETSVSENDLSEYSLTYHDIDVPEPDIVGADDTMLSADRASAPDSFYITPNLPNMRDQGIYGTCWAFSAIGASEASLIRKGIATKDINLSESHLAYFFYNKATNVGDKLGNEVGDYNRNGDSNYLQQGGNSYFTMWQLASWEGLVSESSSADFVYEKLAQNKIIDSVFGGYSSSLAMKNDTATAYGSDSYHLQNAYIVNTADKAAMKDMIVRYGSVGISYYATTTTNSAKPYDSGAANKATTDSYQYGSYYVNTSQVTNHAVQIVGWNDTYSKNNFVTTPRNDGAWLVKNSWGAEDCNNIEQTGYFWLSYEDKSLSPEAFAFDAEAADNYDNIYQYDGAGGVASNASYAVGNIFTAKANGKKYEELSAVAIGVDDTNVNYTVDIYNNVSGTNPTNGMKVASQSGTFKYAGYQTVKLNKPVYVTPGRNYSVVFTFTNGSKYINYDTSYSNGGWVNFYTSETGGQSFWKRSASSNWYDVSSEDVTMRVKAFTNNTNISVKSIESISLSAAELNLDKDASQTLTVGINPADTTDDKTIGFTSSDTSVATVDNNGVVTGKKYGTATITASTLYGHTATCTVNVVSTDAATPILLSTEASSSSKVKLTWVKGYNAAGYQIYRSTKKSGSYELIKTITKGSKTSYTDSKVSCGKTYYYKIKSYKKNGKKKVLSGYSSRMKVKVVPSTVTVKKVTASKKSAKVTWGKVSKASGYEIYRSTSATSKGKKIATVGKKTSYTDKKAKGSTTYYYRVRAYQLVNGKKVYGSLSEAKGSNG